MADVVLAKCVDGVVVNSKIIKPKFDEKKTTELASIFLKLNGGKMNALKLVLLIYNADREALKRWARPLTYDDYYATKYGMVGINTFKLVTGKDIDEI